MTKRLLPLAAMERIMKKAGADRVSEDARQALKDVLEEVASDIAATSIRLAQHAGRKTVKEEDINLAYKNLSKGSLP